MVDDSMNSQLVEMEILPGGWCGDVEGKYDIGRSIHDDQHAVLRICKSLQLVSVIAGALAFNESQMLTLDHLEVLTLTM
jgi:hypothetical protein